MQRRPELKIALRMSIPILFSLLLCLPFTAEAQVISNNQAAITITNGAAVVTKDMTNTSGTFPAQFQNNGTINLSGNFTNNVSSVTSGNGTFRLGGNWTNPGTFSYGLSTVIFNGSIEQLITKPSPETFYNLSVANTGASSGFTVRLDNLVQVIGNLSIINGNITATGYKLFLVNQAAASLIYTSTTKSRIFGQFERGVGQAGTYLFPVSNISRPSYYNAATLITNSIPVTGSVLTEFLISPPPGNAGLPLADVSADPGVEVDSAYTAGYWRMTARNSFSSSNYSVTLEAEGFTNSIDTVRDITRVIKRTGTANWTLDGVHNEASGNLIKRNNLTGNISTAGTQFGLGRANPLITDHPDDLTVCEMTYPSFTVVASGAGPLTYMWFKDGNPIISGTHYTGNRSSTLVINEAVLSDAGSYYCVVRDRYRNVTISTAATLVVMKIPVANITPNAQDHECSEVPFEDMILGLSYYNTGTIFTWSRTTPAGISTSIPVTGTENNIGDALSGSFRNTTDAPITITFEIIPIGPAPTYCTGLPIYATITVNPRPRVIPVVNEICYGGSTNITLVSPSTMTKPKESVMQFGYRTYRTSPMVGGFMGDASNVFYGSVISNPYSNDSDTSQSIIYKVVPTITAELGCPAGDSVLMETKIHAKPLQNFIITKPLTCDGGSDASLKAITSRGAGGTNGYFFEWKRPVNDTVSGYNLSELVNRRGGYWTVKVRDNLNCTNSGNIAVAGASLDSYMNVPIDPVTGFATSCPGSSDGQIELVELSSSSGIAPYEYWITRNNQDTVSTNMHGFLINKEVPVVWSGLQAGEYHLFIKDSNGCFNTTMPQTTLSEPEIITVTFETRKYDGNFDISCKGYNDGSVWINSIEGGNGGYRYKWTTTNGLISGIDTLNRLENITAGTYYLNTTDHKGCTKTDSIIISEPDGMVLTASELSVKPDGNYNISCNGGSDGSINITLNGGSGNYSYLWSGPSGFTSDKEDISGLKAGVYTTTVRDLNGCLLAPVPSFTLQEPADLTIISTPSVSPDGGYNISCNGGTGSVQIAVAGGIPGTYQYVWSTTDGSGIIAGQEDQNSITAGTYNLTVRDINGCEETIVVTMRQPDKISLEFIEKNITCASGVFNDGSIDLVVSGGAGSFTYLWSNGATSQDLSGLTEGDYSVTVTDFNGCSMTGSGTVVNPPPLRYTSVLSDYNGFNISCFNMSNGSIKISTTNGSPPFIFTWSGPDGFTATTQSITDLRAGTYVLNITDSLACSVTETFVLTEPGELGMAFSLSSSTAGGFNINCAGETTGYIGIEPLNAVKDVEYLWSDGLFGRTRTNLPAGEYSVIITDANNCYASATVELTQPDSLKIGFIVDQPFCPDMPDGSIVAEVTGGVPGADYDYRWSDNSTGNTLSDITAGFYSLTVRDLNGCMVRDSVIVDPENESCLIIPNAISPNGDLINDEWNIDNIDLYPEAEVKIFNRWGLNIWKSAKGYPQPWDGRRNGKGLPIDSYHYIIDLHNGKKPVIGTVTVVR